mmetsp:Transcript_30969/g.35287  ORF Transcript_30969/g.35287 Transcript_30969/m.35287 type:complete len:302 (-) Transcript_30969:153-1058(-)
MNRLQKLSRRMKNVIKRDRSNDSKKKHRLRPRIPKLRRSMNSITRSDQADDLGEQRKRRLPLSMRNIFKKNLFNSKRQQKGMFSFRRKKSASDVSPPNTIITSLSDDFGVPGAVYLDDISLHSFTSEEKEKNGLDGNGSFGSEPLNNNQQQEKSYDCDDVDNNDCDDVNNNDDDNSKGETNVDPFLAEIVKTLDYNWANEERKNLREKELSINNIYMSEVTDAECLLHEMKNSETSGNLMKMAIIAISTAFLALIVTTVPQLSFLKDLTQEQTNTIKKPIHPKLDDKVVNFTWDMVFSLEG